MSTKPPYESLYTHGFVRAAAAVSSVKIGDIGANLRNTIELAQSAAERNVLLTVFPELGLSGYSNDDLFHQEALLNAATEGLTELVHESERIDMVVVVGLPLRVAAKLYNVAVVLYKGRILGATPKSYLPNYREFYEKRQFASGYDVVGRSIRLAGQQVPFGVDLLFEVENLPDLVFHTEICEDIWVPAPPSTIAALAGATVLLNLSASNVTIGKSEYRHSMGADQSGRCIAAYLYTAAGFGESTTDLAWDGDAHIHENGRLLAKSERFSLEPQLVTADLHLRALVQDRMRMTSFIDNAQRSGAAERFRRIRFEVELPGGAVALERDVPRFPYVPANPDRRDERCFEAYSIQVQGLVTRLNQTAIRKMVIGISGGLDSTQALIVACNAADLLGIPRENILSYTMPGFATSERTRTNAWALMRSLGVTAEEIDIRPSCMQMFRDIGHPYAEGTEEYDVTFENVQAGERTSHLFRIANQEKGFVIGTGDLSELALGWATYGVGDHMSHYAVNASVPKTLIQHLIRWVADTNRFGSETSEVLRQILDTEISPELVPATQDKGGDQPSQLSEASIGPYELQDFHLYYLTRFGLAPSDVAYLAERAWHNREVGFWPPDVPSAKRNQYTRAEIVRWLRVFLRRFFGSSQFKRSCIPNAPKVGSGGSLSPRGDWRAPSDSYPDLWLDELDRNVPGE